MDKRIERSKKALKNAMIVLLKTMEYEEITIKKIVEQADYSAPTFYKYYKSKEGLMHAIIDDELNELYKMFYNSLNMDKQKKQVDLKNLVYLIFNHIYNNRELYVIIFTKQSLFQHAEYFIQKWYVFGKDKLDIRGTTIMTEFEKYLKCNALFNAIKFWYNNNFSFSPGYMGELFCEIVFDSDRQVLIRKI